jgi:peptidoglycan/LPS O-acetylase OafA/YrhL
MMQELLGWPHVDTVYWTLQIELCFYAIAFLLFSLRLLAKAELVLASLMLLAAADYLFGKHLIGPSQDGSPSKVHQFDGSEPGGAS